MIEGISPGVGTNHESSDCASSPEGSSSGAVSGKCFFPDVPAFPHGKNAATITGSSPMAQLRDTSSPTDPPRDAESVAADQLVANLSSDAAFVSGSSFTFALRFNRFTIEPCRFVESFSGCRAGDDCRFSHLSGAGREECLHEVRRHKRRGVSLTIHDVSPAPVRAT